MAYFLDLFYPETYATFRCSQQDIQATVLIYVFSSVMPVKTGIQASLMRRTGPGCSSG